MQLWTEYEGVTIDGAFPLKKLLVPEGRSAFFSTSNAKGEPTFVRLIECHFDEDEILSRWHSLAVLNHPNFLKLERYGRIELDGGPVAYAVFEKVDANLASVLDEGHLIVKDVAQLASSMVAALDVLHTHGFVHEHVEPRNIFAVGEQVKLRSDCIRESPEGDDGRAIKQRDVHDLAMVILQALTQRKSLDGIPDYAVPPPFSQIIRNGLDGTWGLKEIRDALEGKSGGNAGLMARTAPETVEPATATIVAPVASPAVPVTPAAAPAGATPSEERVASAVRPPVREEAQLSLPLGDKRERIPHRGQNLAESLGEDWDRRVDYARMRRYRDAWDDERDGERSFSLRSRWVGVAVIVALVLLLLMGVVHAWKAHRNESAQVPPAVTQPSTPAAKHVSSSAAAGRAAAVRHNATAKPSAVAKPSPAVKSGPVMKSSPAESPGGNLSASAAGSRAIWRVIAFTYNRKADAEKKVSSLVSKHPDLRPEVFSANGGSPYLVSIGGAMNRDAAYALARRARSLGLPRDTYAQNYSH